MRKILFVLIIFSFVFCTRNKKTDEDKNSYSYTGDSLKTIAFPIGGIGTGDITLGGRGNIFEMEIFNQPAKNNPSDAFFMIWAKEKGKDPVTKIIERNAFPPFTPYGFGAEYGRLYGFSRFENVTFKGEFPLANIYFSDPLIPVQLELEAYNPFIPLDVDNSSIPAAIFNWKVSNPTNSDVDITLTFNMKNPIKTKNAKGNMDSEYNKNEFITDHDLSGILFSSSRAKKDSTDFGNIFFGTTEKNIDVQTHWTEGEHWDAYHILSDDLAYDGSVKDDKEPFGKTAEQNDNTQFATIAVHVSLKAGEEKRFPFYLSWYFPNRKSIPCGTEGLKTFVYKNYYATKFSNSEDAVSYILKNQEYLYAETRKFHDLVYNSSVPYYVKDAIMSQAATLKTNLVIRDEKGEFYGYEGLADGNGCCEGSCTHVWNYEQTLAFLFPSLERSMRDISFLYDTPDNGYQSFRDLFPPHGELWHYYPAADGQMGNIVRVYREWKISGDQDWLKKIWPKTKTALEFAWKGVGNVSKEMEWQKEKQPIAWDPNKIGVMEGMMHNTYDIEFYGPNTMTTSIYLAALKACSEMATAMGEPGKSKEYLDVYNKGVTYCDDNLWNGNYYFQDVKVLDGLKIPDHLKPIAAGSKKKKCNNRKGCCNMDEMRRNALDKEDRQPKYQYGQGCLSDQLLGQFLAHVSGLGYILDKKHVDEAMKSIFNNNFKNTFSNFNNVQRVYALNNEPGLVLCTWPKGMRPALPFIYCDEVWTGIEYQVAASLIYSGYTDEGLKVVKAIRTRYAGFNRNPWDEIECGHHYARAMASWAVLLALSGYQYDGVNHSLSFDPKINREQFNSFWSCGTGWGNVEIKGKEFILTLTHGSLLLSDLKLGNDLNLKEISKIEISGKEIKAAMIPGEPYNIIKFNENIEWKKGDVLNVTFK